MPHWFIQTIEGDDTSNKITKVLGACIGKEQTAGEAGLDLRITIGTNKKIQPHIKQELTPFNNENALNRLYNVYQESVIYVGEEEAEVFFYRTLYLFNAIVKKIDPEYNNILVSCATNLSILTALQEKHYAGDEHTKFNSVLEFNKSIGNPIIEVSNAEITSFGKSPKLLQQFLEQTKETLFLQGFQPEDASEVCNSLRKLERTGWQYYDKTELASWLENTFLDNQIPAANKNTRTLKL